jgi:hypothetical protein
MTISLHQQVLNRAVTAFLEKRISLGDLELIHQRYTQQEKEMSTSKVGSLLYFSNPFHKDETEQCGSRQGGIVIDFNLNARMGSVDCLTTGQTKAYAKPWISNEDLGLVTIMNSFGTYKVPYQSCSGYGGSLEKLLPLITVELAKQIRNRFALHHYDLEFERHLRKVLNESTELIDLLLPMQDVLDDYCPGEG